MNSIKVIFILAFLFLHLENMQGKNIAIDGNDSGKVVIIKDERIDTLINRNIRINTKKQSFPGYRVQIYFGSRRVDALNAKAEFIRQFPDIKPYELYHPPNYKIRVGDFRTRHEAFKLYEELLAKYRFKTVFIVTENISISEL